eukprot:scaffold145_cov195-Alexandrium_tamarense.AAC.9
MKYSHSSMIIFNSEPAVIEEEALIDWFRGDYNCTVDGERRRRLLSASDNSELVEGFVPYVVVMM